MIDLSQEKAPFVHRASQRGGLFVGRAQVAVETKWCDADWRYANEEGDPGSAGALWALSQ